MAKDTRRELPRATKPAEVRADSPAVPIGAIRQRDGTAMRPAVDEAAMDGLKFSECLPLDQATEMLERRLQEPEATRQVLEQRVRFVMH